MKNRIYTAAFVFVSLVCSLSSCKKFDHDRDERVAPAVQVSTDTREINANETLQYVLPESFIVEQPVIITQATSYSKSVLEQDATTRNWIYTYVPNEGFMGNDQVVIDSQNDGGIVRNARKGHHKCGDDAKETLSNRLILNISVLGETASK